MENLKYIFNQVATVERSTATVTTAALAQKRRELDFDGFQEIIITKAKLALPLEQLNSIFGCSKMTVIKDNLNFKTYRTLQFVEFLEALCRCAHQYHFDSSVSHTLVNKLEHLLDSLFNTYELYRVRVNKDDNKSSSSD